MLRHFSLSSFTYHAAEIQAYSNVDADRFACIVLLSVMTFSQKLFGALSVWDKDDWEGHAPFPAGFCPVRDWMLLLSCQSLSSWPYPEKQGVPFLTIACSAGLLCHCWGQQRFEGSGEEYLRRSPQGTIWRCPGRDWACLHQEPISPQRCEIWNPCWPVIHRFHCHSWGTCWRPADRDSRTPQVHILLSQSLDGEQSRENQRWNKRRCQFYWWERSIGFFKAKAAWRSWPAMSLFKKIIWDSLPALLELAHIGSVTWDVYNCSCLKPLICLWEVRKWFRGNSRTI